MLLQVMLAVILFQKYFYQIVCRLDTNDYIRGGF